MRGNLSENEGKKSAMELSETIELMQSGDYKERFKAEYWQTKIRSEKLRNMLVKYEVGTLEFEPLCSLDFLKRQYAVMGDYLYILELRAEAERIEL